MSDEAVKSASDKNMLLINTQEITLSKEETVEDILGRAKSLGIKFKKEMEEDLDRLSELQELVHDAERERTYLKEEGDETALHDEVIAILWEEISALSKKIR
jgi:hypothetical protein